MERENRLSNYYIVDVLYGFHSLEEERRFCNLVQLFFAKAVTTVTSINAQRFRLFFDGNACPDFCKVAGKKGRGEVAFGRGHRV